MRNRVANPNSKMGEERRNRNPSDFLVAVLRDFLDPRSRRSWFFDLSLIVNN